MTWVLLCLAAAVALWPGRRRLLPSQAGRSPSAWVGERLRRRRAEGPDLASVVEVLALTLSAGLTPSAALRVVVDGWPDLQDPPPWWAELAAVAERGGSLGLGRELQRVARLEPRVRLLADAWELSERTGAPVADAVATVAEALRSAEAARARLDAETAGSRATMTLLCCLPALGPGVTLLLGLDPLEAYTGNPVVLLVTGLGVALAGSGWVVGRWLLARAVRPPVVEVAS